MLFSSKSNQQVECAGSSTSIIGSGVVLAGDITCTADIRIDGTVTGNIHSTARVLIGASGIVQGDIESAQADILGTVSGNISIKDLLNLRGKSVINGNIHAGSLQIEPSVCFNGQCFMNNHANVVVEMTKDINERPKIASK